MTASEATPTPEETVEDSAATPADAEKPPRQKISPKEWAKIEALWELGEVTYVELVKKYGRDISTFSRHFAKRGVKKGAKREKMKERVAEEMARAEISEAHVTAQRIRETKEEHYRMATALGRLTWNEVLAARKNKTPFGAALNNLKALNAAIVNLKVVREERYAVLGLDRDDAVDLDQLPELIISELTPEQVKQLRDRDHTTIEDGPTEQGEAGADIDDDDEDDAVVEIG